MDGRPPRGFYLSDEEYAALDPEDERRVKHDANEWNWPKHGAISQVNMQKQQAQQQQDQMAAQQQHEQEMAAQGQPTGWEEDQDGYGGPQDEDDGYGQPSARQPFGGRGGPQAGQGPSQPTPPTAMRKGRRRVRPVKVYVYDLDEE
jgi:hypothetical protein